MRLYFEKFILSMWWVIIFMLLCYMFYEQGLKKRNIQFQELNLQLLELRKQKALASAIQEDLRLQINSQSDPDWIELTLMKGLGLVPEGQIKVFFKNPDYTLTSNYTH